MNSKAQKGFTLIEILVVIGLIAILAAIVLIAINPARQFAQARNSQRVSNIDTIMNAIGQNLADNKGTLTGCPTIGASTSTIGSPTAGTIVDMSGCLGAYISNGIPSDPAGDAANTKYDISYNSANGRYTICAPNYAEAALGTPSIYCVTR